MPKSIEDFARRLADEGLSHADLAVAVLWYLDAGHSGYEISVSELVKLLKSLGLASTSTTRLTAQIKKTKQIMIDRGRVRLKLAARQPLTDEYGVLVGAEGDVSSERGHSSPVLAKSIQPKPRVFIGSSSEGLKVAEYIQLGLDYVAECTVWTQGVFELSKGNLENLLAAVKRVDYAVLVLSQDDVVSKRGEMVVSPRDNVLFELGLFIGALGREKTAMVYCRDDPPDLPTDLLGLTPATYARRRDGNLQAALGAVCTRLKEFMNVAQREET